MKTLALILTLTAVCMLAACESTSPAPATQTPGTAIGNSGFHASGTVETGGSVSNH